MRISDWSSDVCSSDLAGRRVGDQLVVGEAPLRPQREHHRGDHQDEEMIEEVPQVEEQEVQSVAHHPSRPRRFTGSLQLAPFRPVRLARPGHPRSEEHTSELQSLMRISYAVFCLKKKNKYNT